MGHLEFLFIMFWGYKSIHQSAVCTEIGSINAYCSKRLSGHCLTKSWKLYYSISLSFTASIPFLRRFHPICSFKWNLKHNGTYSIYLGCADLPRIYEHSKNCLNFHVFLNDSVSSSRPWLCYWILHSIALLGDSVDDELENNTIDFLSRCQV